MRFGRPTGFFEIFSSAVRFCDLRATHGHAGDGLSALA